MNYICHIGSILQKRKEQGKPIDRYWLAEQLGIKYQMLNKYINNKADIPMSKAIKLSILLETPINELFTPKG
ncbi:Helix-turn-helix [Seinonella peptonophila]|uniref:Helix-turn-helix n=1 Tax=Seinonella peptonophila TaxID=112248 RepID=A0A1M4ZQY8_9BACL|nr:helix-turn-helix transcriptional regulator [Seinonella peptonophila]SHF20431.1 Helix-turn-helix [Seinonella peptonophila]